MSVYGGYEAEIRNALDVRCRELDLNLMVVFGGAVDEPHPWSTAQNAIFDLVHPDRVDALVVVSTCLSAYCGAAGVAKFVQRYRPMPTCSLGVLVPDTPSVEIDSRPGMEAVVEHIIRDHGCRRLAFLGGPPQNPEAELRLQVYREVLERYGLTWNPALVAVGHFMSGPGQAAMEEIIAGRVPFDAVVAGNDAMAMGAISALRKHGYSVPHDLPVTGFDDVVLARVDNPPLTTVAQPFAAMADAALGLVMDQLAGRTAAGCVRLSAEFVCRQSCGCHLAASGPASESANRSTPDTAQHVRERIDVITSELTGCLGGGNTDAAEAAQRLAAGLQRELAGMPRSFLRSVEALLAQVGDDPERYGAFQEAVTRLREQLRPVSTGELEDLWHAARVSIAQAGTSGQAQRRLEMDETYARLLGVGERLSVVLDLAGLQQALVQSLPTVGVQTAFLSQYPESGSDELEAFVCLLDGSLREVSSTRFAARLLFPPDAYPADRRHTSLVFPLAFENQRLGVAVFEHSMDGLSYSMLRDQISVALRSLRLHQEVVQRTKLHERSVQERRATFDRMTALSVLAGGVAHDLNNSLAPLVALPDVILRELDGLGLDHASAAARMRSRVESIRTAAERATQTIRDLMTLGRHGRTQKTPFDLNRTVSRCLTSEPLLFAHRENRKVEVALELHDAPLVVRASQHHLERAVSNLIRNAAEALADAGRITVRTSRIRLTEALAAYETVPPGEYAVVAVSDTGEGIRPEDLGRLFEPFFTNKKLRETCGSGLGLAIVHGVVKEHDGFVDVASTLGSGTTFRLYLPLPADPVADSGSH